MKNKDIFTKWDIIKCLILAPIGMCGMGIIMIIICTLLNSPAEGISVKESFESLINFILIRLN